MKLLSLQKLCCMDAVFVRHIVAALRLVGDAQHREEAELNREEVTATLNRMFEGVSQEVPGHVTVAAPEETCSLMFRLFDRTRAGRVSAVSLQTALIALSADSPLAKYRALVRVSRSSSGSISRSGLTSLLLDLSQVPAAVQEEAVFGGVETAVRSCFNEVSTPTVSRKHVLSWLQSEPRLLLWLPMVYQLCVSQNVSHAVRCHTCKTFPITGLRYRCMKCVNVHVCQNCFLSDRQTRKHKAQHPVLEFCTQPTWKESLSSFVRSARYTLLPWRYNQRQTDRRRVLMWAEPGETPNSALPPPDASNRMADPAVNHGAVSHDASVCPPSCSSVSKALQTDEETQQAATLLTEVRNLQRDKWLLEQQLQAWRITVQSEQGMLEDRCSEMEVTMETLRQHNVRLQGMLTQALNNMEAQQHASDTPHANSTENTDTDDFTPTPSNTEEEDEEEEEEKVLETEDEWREHGKTPSPTVHHGTSHDLHYEEEGSAGDMYLCGPIEQVDGPEEAEQQREDKCLSEEDDGDCGTCSLEELLQETVDRLKTMMEADRWKKRETGDRKWAELLQAADQVGDSIHHLVDTVRTHTH
ncbi:dystrotelin [Mastacembelus armatus]|uniref:dystrotelin n=1 Tax=Mastacembelus armatus TaxID=205130 RepID=UPI000E453A08|nr:dystrotelin [Mastacembelus armatus]